MASLTVRDISEQTVSTLKRRAVRNHRSLNGEILSIFAYVSSFNDGFEFPLQPGGVGGLGRKKDPIMELAGKWEDSRPIEATIADIEKSRTFGREVAL